jgi:hypothetical protein
MKRTLLFATLLLTLSFAIGQNNINKEKCQLGPQTQPELTPLITAPDFTVTFTDGSTGNLYNTCNAGNSVLLDFFFTTCSYCILYAPIIDQSYVAHGSGTGNIKYWGIDNGNTNAEVIAYKSAYGVTNPCASGTEGGANAVTTTYSTTYAWSGWPTYSVVCPDKTYSHDVNYPPTATGFNSYYTTCGTTSISLTQNVENKVTFMYPNPAAKTSNIHFNIAENSSVKIEMFDMVGKLIYNYSENTQKGMNDLKLNLENIENGTYYVRLSANGEQIAMTKLFVIQ